MREREREERFRLKKLVYNIYIASNQYYHLFLLLLLLPAVVVKLFLLSLFFTSRARLRARVHATTTTTTTTTRRNLAFFLLVFLSQKSKPPSVRFRRLDQFLPLFRRRAKLAAKISDHLRVQRNRFTSQLVESFHADQRSDEDDERREQAALVDVAHHDDLP